MQTTANTILVTGGGSGIGRELALRLHAQGNTVIVTGRRLDALQSTIDAHARMHAMVLNVDDPQAITAFAQQVLEQFPQLNVLINNAGIMRYEDLSTHGDLHDAEAQISTNLLGTIRVTNALIDQLKQQPHAAVVTVSSGLAFVPRADAAVYSASKAAVHVYTQCLRQQLAGQVEVIELVPPAVQTELTPGQSEREGYLPLHAFMDEVMALFNQQPTPSEIVVERACLQRLAEREGRFEQVFDRINANAAQQRR
ncbi:SDR family oxidoreductase [Pectobacterium sp. B1J-3]|uniref:SDR family oxidoreductase n=1 Tax=Pectobacterium sp. B1J-3 TaxID=3385371 RepID=UPI0039057996